MTEIAEDEFTGNTDVGQATQRGSIWLIATDQAVIWPPISHLTQIHADLSALFHAGATARAHAINTSLSVEFSGKVDLTAPTALTFDNHGGTKLEISVNTGHIVTNRASLAGSRIRLDETIEARLLHDEVTAAISQIKVAATSLKSGAFSTSVAEKIRV